MPNSLATPAERGLARVVRQLALVFSVTVTFALPLTYFYLDYSRLNEHVQTLARVKSGALDALASDNPELWKFSQIRMEEVLQRGPFLIVAERVTVRDAAGNPVLTKGELPDAPFLTLSSPIHDFGRVVGHVEVAHSYRVVVFRALGAALLGLLLGGIVHTVSVRPLRALRRVSAELAAEQAALRAREERYCALFERASDGILIVSPGGSIIAANASFARMHGYSAEEMLKMNLNDLGTQESARLTSERLERTRSGKSLFFEVEHYHKDGHVFPLEASVSLVVSGGETLIQTFYRDITERTRQRKLVAEHNALLLRQKAALEATLGRIKRLEGLISICMYCKKVRAENNDWQQLEKYVIEHSDANFSHGLCPECLAEQMKELS